MSDALILSVNSIRVNAEINLSKATYLTVSIYPWLHRRIPTNRKRGPGLPSIFCSIVKNQANDTHLHCRSGENDRKSPPQRLERIFVVCDLSFVEAVLSTNHALPKVQWSSFLSLRLIYCLCNQTHLKFALVRIVV